MEPTYMTADALAADPASARKVAKDGPVIITEDGQSTHVLLTIQEFERLRGKRRTLWGTFEGRGNPGDDGSDLDIRKLQIRMRPASFDD